MQVRFKGQLESTLNSFPGKALLPCSLKDEALICRSLNLSYQLLGCIEVLLPRAPSTPGFNPVCLNLKAICTTIADFNRRTELLGAELYAGDSVLELQCSHIMYLTI
jgi:hypothetical protein